MLAFIADLLSNSVVYAEQLQLPEYEVMLWPNPVNVEKKPFLLDDWLLTTKSVMLNGNI